MESGQILAPPEAEVVMVEPELVRQIRFLHEAGWGAKSIAREVAVARNTVRRYLRSPQAEVQVRAARRALDAEACSQARELFAGAAGGNAVVVQQMLEAQGVELAILGAPLGFFPSRDEACEIMKTEIDAVVA